MTLQDRLDELMAPVDFLSSWTLLGMSKAAFWLCMRCGESYDWSHEWYSLHATLAHLSMDAQGKRTGRLWPWASTDSDWPHD